MGTAVVHGFEIDAELAKGLTVDARNVLRKIGYRGSAIFEIDDGPQDLKTVQQLEAIVKEDGYFHMFNEGHTYCVIEDKFQAHVKLVH